MRTRRINSTRSRSDYNDCGTCEVRSRPGDRFVLAPAVGNGRSLRRSDACATRSPLTVRRAALIAVCACRRCVASGDAAAKHACACIGPCGGRGNGRRRGARHAARLASAQCRVTTTAQRAGSAGDRLYIPCPRIAASGPSGKMRPHRSHYCVVPYRHLSRRPCWRMLCCHRTHAAQHTVASGASRQAACFEVGAIRVASTVHWRPPAREALC